MKLVLVAIATGYDLILSSSRPEKLRRQGVTLASHRGAPLVFKGDCAQKSESGKTSGKALIPSLSGAVSQAKNLFIRKIDIYFFKFFVKE
jgi:hypothetical protein